VHELIVVGREIAKPQAPVTSPRIDAMGAETSDVLERRLGLSFFSGHAATLGSIVEDIIAETAGIPVKRGPGRPPKSSVVASTLPSTIPPKRMGPAMIDSVANLITRYVKSHQGARAEAIRKELGIPKNKWAVPLAFALEKKGLSKKGEKRATTYWVK
jgi:hypothetical protein